MTRTHRIADILHSHLPDLVSMPVDPAEAVVVGEASIDAGNGRIERVQLIDHEAVKQL